MFGGFKVESVITLQQGKWIEIENNGESGLFKNLPKSVNNKQRTLIHRIIKGIMVNTSMYKRVEKNSGCI